MAIHRMRDDIVTFDLSDASEVLGHEVRIIDNFATLGGDSEDITHRVEGIERAPDGGLTIYLDLRRDGAATR